MPEEQEKQEARQESAPEPTEPTPRGNVHSAPDKRDQPGAPPPPHPN